MTFIDVFCITGVECVQNLHLVILSKTGVMQIEDNAMTERRLPEQTSDMVLREVVTLCTVGSGTIAGTELISWKIVGHDAAFVVRPTVMKT